MQINVSNSHGLRYGYGYSVKMVRRILIIFAPFDSYCNALTHGFLVSRFSQKIANCKICKCRFAKFLQLVNIKIADWGEPTHSLLNKKNFIEIHSVDLEILSAKCFRVSRLVFLRFLGEYESCRWMDGIHGNLTSWATVMGRKIITFVCDCRWSMVGRETTLG